MNEREYQTFKVKLRNMGPENAKEVRALVKSMANVFVYVKWVSLIFLLIGIPLSFIIIGVPMVLGGLVGAYLGFTAPRQYIAYGERYIEESQMPA